jgi:hypothetical protein
MTRALIVRTLALVAVLGLTVAATSSDAGVLHLRTKLTGFEEVTPKLTMGMGTFDAVAADNALTYTLTFSDLTTPAFMAHIHFAQKGVNGGIFIWLCGSAAAPGPAGTPTCPAGGGTVSRTVTQADVVAPSPDQGDIAGRFAAVLSIVRSGDAYVNVHTTRFPGGEIRGQVSVNGASDE